MENASKALIISGAILLAVLVISLLIYMAVSNGNFLLSSTENEQKEASIYNGKFIKYEGKEVSGTDVKELLKIVYAVNNDEDTSNDITVEGEPQNNIRNNRTYTVSLGYENRNCK